MELKFIADISPILFGLAVGLLAGIQALVIGAKALHHEALARRVVELSERFTWLFRLST